MHHLSDPVYSFTIPSVHDDTALNCRIYHPDALSEPHTNGPEPEASWRTRGIVMAHPYAPMGGSYEDRVVGIVVEEFLKAGWVVGTFNFRGAHGSKSRTSWSGRPELDDYNSFAAFFMHYMCYLRPHPKPEASYAPEQSSIASQANLSKHAPCRLPTESPIVVLGGYSYGSMILQHLPPVPTILQPFSNPIAGSANDEILLRAHKLADQSNLAWANLARHQERERRSRKRGHEPKSSVTMGGEETTPEKRRTSRDVRRSYDRGLSVEFGSRLRSLSHRGRKGDSPATSLEKVDVVPVTVPEIRYLLISPLMPPISTVLAPLLGHKFWSKPRAGSEDVIGKHATLAIYGDQDMFTSAKRLREWSEHLKSAQGSQFSSVEVAGAGHFWVESGAEVKLRAALGEWEAGIR